MRVLVTGAKGFVGRNLVAQLNNIKDGKYKTDIQIDEVYQYDIDSSPDELDIYCQNANFIFNLAGVNRPTDPADFQKGNFGFASTLLDKLKQYHNTSPVMISSSIQATLEGRFAGSEYGKSKKAGEDLMFQYAQETGAKVLVYRFPNLFGKWCRPNYNSAVATFCNNIANNLPIQVNDPNVELELLYIDDLIDEMLDALRGREHYIETNTNDFSNTNLNIETNTNLTNDTNNYSLDSCNLCSKRYCHCPVTFKVKLGEIVELLQKFHDMPQTLLIPEIPANSFAKRLYSTYLSYLPKEGAIFDLKMNTDPRGSFTELVHTLNNGQVSINISKPGITKGQHWHHTKWEQFIVVKGHGLIQMRPENSCHSCNSCSEIREYEVSGDKIQSVIMLPGYTHNIINLSDHEDLVTVMYCNEIFDPQKPDTFFDPV